MVLAKARIEQLLIPFVSPLAENKLAAIAAYLDLLLKWNAKMNLTAVRNPEEIVTRHFGESLFAARHLFPEPLSASIADVGSGAGFPGLPLKIWNKDAALTLIESNQKKASFLREVVRIIGMKQVSVESSRAETLSLKTDVVSLRAVERFSEILPAARQLLKPNGRLALLIGESQVEESQSLLPELDWQEPIAVPLSEKRCFLVGKLA